MSTTRSQVKRRLLSVLTAGALSAGTLMFAAPAHAADVPATTTGSGPTKVTDGSFVWGISGYAQKGVFGAWNIKDLTGNVSLLDGATQTEYATAPVPATSFPASGITNPRANAVKFTGGTGTIDEETGAGKLAWTGKYVVNAYPANFNAPDETYEDPELTVAADGSGFLTVDFSIGAGETQGGDPFPAQDFGRIKLATFDAGSLSAKSSTGYRITPDYQGVTNGLAGQTTTCSTDGATGWWGSWPQEFINALNSHASGQSVLPHFYSTGCGGSQDLKPPLPIDVTFHAADAPTVTVSDTRINPDGTTTITVTGANFDPSLATGTRPPLSGLPAGTYIAFGKFAENWRPSQGAASDNRKTGANGTAVKWAVLSAYTPSPVSPGAGGIVLSPEGSFTAEVQIDKAALDASAGAGTEAFRYGIYTYPGSGGVAPAYETYTPLTFGKDESTLTVSGPSSASYGTKVAKFVASVSSGTGTITVTGAGAAQTLDLVDKQATFTLPTLNVGKRTLTFTYSGDATHDGATATKQVTVTKRSTTTAVDKLTMATSKKSGSVRIKVSSALSGVYPTGKVTVTLKKGKSKITRPAKSLSKGKATVTLPKLGKGKWTVRLAYAGSANYGSSAKEFTRTVK